MREGREGGRTRLFSLSSSNLIPTERKKTLSTFENGKKSPIIRFRAKYLSNEESFCSTDHCFHSFVAFFCPVAIVDHFDCGKQLQNWVLDRFQRIDLYKNMSTNYSFNFLE